MAILSTSGCRFGGPEVSPGDAGVRIPVPVQDTAAPLPEVAVAPDVMVPDPAPPIDAGTTPPIDTGAGGGDGSIASCGAPFAVQVCDPVCNSGCSALLRCDVSDTPQTGACVGIWIGQVGDACFKGTGTDSCAAGLTCLDNKCAKLCYRNADCTTAGTCCSRELEGSSGKTSFKVCAPC
ncbi:MAG TPA: hypothetical protein VGG33_00050 [Polyangia bacterium]